MPLLPRLASLLRTLFQQSRLDRDLDDELAAAADTLAERHLQRGLSPEDARRAAWRDLGGREQTRERTRDVRIGQALLTLSSDTRLAWRGLIKARGFTAAAVLTLALGIGASTAIFSIVNAVLIEPLPYRDSDRLSFVWSDMSHAGYPRGPLSGPELADLRTRTSVFAGFEAIWATTGTLTGGGDPELLRIGMVTGDLFQLLGTAPALGRAFARADEADGPPTSLLLSHALWMRRFGGDPGIVGRAVTFNGRPTTVVGVMPAPFRLLMPADANVPEDLEAWVPFDRGMTHRLRGQMYLRVVARLEPGVTFEAARAEVDAVARLIGRSFPEYGSAGRALALVGLHSEGVSHVRAALLVMLGAVVILLLVATVNVSSLIVARTAARAHETALRIALGAGRWRLFSRWLAEGVVLAALGAAAGLVTARLGLALLVSLRPDGLSRIDRAPLDARVLAVTLLVTAAVAVLFSLAPLTQMARATRAGVLQTAGRRTGAVIQQRVRTALVVVQVSLAVVLVVGAGLLARTFLQVLRVDPGFRTDGIVAFRLALVPGRHGNQEAINAVSRRFQAAVAALPGVTRVGAVSHLPYDNVPNWSTTYLTEPGQDASQARRADARSVAPGYFETVGSRLVEGRFFTEDDDERGRAVAVVDESLARRAWPDGGAVGRELRVDPTVEGRATTTVTIIGVVGHIRHLTLLDEVREQVYFPVRQAPRNPMAYVVRSAADPESLAGPVRALLRDIDPRLPVYDFRSFDDVAERARATARFTMWLGAASAGVALLMACVGLYGVLSYSVASRTHELGLRMALGAEPARMVTLVVRQGMAVAGTGLAIGVVAAWLASRYVEALLFGVTAGDPVSYLIAVPALTVTAVAACGWPACRASRVDPVVALRAE